MARRRPMSDDQAPLIHTQSSGAEAALVNAYLIETKRGIVAVDAMLTVSDARRLRSRVDALGKPLLAVLVTHSHPDHYGGLTELVASDSVPILAVGGVDEVIRRDDEVKEQILRPMFGDEWPQRRTFPNTIVSDAETVTFDGVRFTVLDLGPSESPHDSAWMLGDDERTVFLGDQIVGRVHCYLADGFYREWFEHIDQLRARFPADATFYIGHGGPASPADWDWQRGYLETAVQAIESVDWSDPAAAKAAAMEQITAYCPAEELRFLIELSLEPMAANLGLVAPASG
jgi:glyoxylase-like metal-dependent hydrolase (beta-lactamase superfamily II)